MLVLKLFFIRCIDGCGGFHDGRGDVGGGMSQKMGLSLKERCLSGLRGRLCRFRLLYFMIRHWVGSGWLGTDEVRPGRYRACRSEWRSSLCFSFRVEFCRLTRL